MPNRLANETSPYLLQHANNPVDWYPWGPEALDRARHEQKPIFLSIGYSACHWCHVMEHESFENPDIARMLNEAFVNVKVDREERPDLDHVYMTAVQLMTGRGGWPMSTFLTPDLKPFFGGTYWPPTRNMGMPGFDEVIRAVSQAWQDRRPQALEQADELTRHLTAALELRGEQEELSASLLLTSTASLERAYDPLHGGFGRAPKFPHPMDLRLLLRLWHRTGQDELLQMAAHSLERMAAGGIYDHLGGGFHRYSVDERWLVPHFEKMLYDNALLLPAYVEAFQATGQEDFSRTARETADYVLREMTGPEGGFFSTQDADSEGEEGKFYVWTPAEIEALLGKEIAGTFCYVYDVSEAGNFEGHNILNLPKSITQAAHLRGRDPQELSLELSEARADLLEVRRTRIPPGLDDKVLVSWNALMIDALATAAGPLGEPRYLEAAIRAADFILSRLRRPDGRLLHTWRGGQARLDAYLDDYAALAGALTSLYEATFDERFIEEALALADVMLARFADPAGGGLFFTADDHEAILVRNKELQDSAAPSSNGLAASAFLRLSKLTGRDGLLHTAESILESAASLIRQSPLAAGQLLLSLDLYLGPTPEIVLLGEREQMNALFTDFHRRFIPRRVLAARAEGEPAPGKTSPLSAIFAGKSALPGGIAVYRCQGHTCQQPLHDPNAVHGLWAELAATAARRPSQPPARN
jgi:hypothetical protein